MTLSTDASNSGWGASSHGKTAKGPWTAEQSKLHINTLELLGALYGIQSLLAEAKNTHFTLKMDNVTALAYIRKMGGTGNQEMNNITT